MQDSENKTKSLLHTLPALLFGAGFFMAVLSGTAALANGCGQSQEVGRHDMTLTSGDQARVYRAFIPSGYTGQAKVPVVFDFHGSDSSANEQLDRSGWERLAERDGFVAVAPQGSLPTPKGNFAWNVPGVTKGSADDEAYIRDVIHAVAENFCVDESRFYATGYSGGGRMLSQYICDGHTDFAAAGFVVGLRAGYPIKQGETWVPDPATCKPAKPISLIAFAGLEDKINPIGGQGQPYWGYGADAALLRWADLDGCKPPLKVSKTGHVEKTEYQACAHGTHIVSYKVDNAGHTWAGSTPLLKIQNILGRVSFDLNATDLMWDFFSTSKS